MIKHYLKVAFRNLMKYKTQSLVSIIGLAVGFTCFALSVLWIRYEMTYDTFHKGAERIYMVRAHYTDIPEHISNSTPYPLAAYLQEKMPEIEAKATTSIHQNVDVYKRQVWNPPMHKRHVTVSVLHIGTINIIVPIIYRL